MLSAAAPTRERPAETAGATPADQRDGRSRLRRIDWWRLAPTLLTTALAVAYVILKPRSPDLAAHIFRAELFGREGFTIWNGQWYGGHHTPAYSILSPPLVWLLGPQVTGALAAIGATACFTELVRRHFGPQRYRWGALWFGLGSASLMATNRLPFALGTAFGLAAVLALQRDRRLLAPPLAVLAAVSSPVAGLFVAMAGVAHALAARGEGVPVKRADGAALAAGGLIPPVLLTVAFPEGGYAPFPFTAYVAIPLFAVAALVVLPRSEHTLRIGAVLYALGATLAIVVDTAMGGNAVRLGALLGGPLLACSMSGRMRRPVVPIVMLFAALMVWQWSAAARDLYKAATDPVAETSYFDPVREYLRLLPDQRRVEIPFTLGHWEGAEVASDFPMARGWLRQLDTGRNPIFYKGAPERADLRELAVGERRALRRPARRQARQQRLPRGGADRAGTALPAPAGALRALAHLRGHAAHAGGDRTRARGHPARAAGLRSGAAAGAPAWLGAGARALDALLAGQGRLRGARRRLDARDRDQARLPEAGDPLRARARGPTRQALQQRLTGANRPTRRPL